MYSRTKLSINGIFKFTVTILNSPGGYPTICGGLQDRGNGSTMTDLCYQYAPEVDTWFESGRLQTSRNSYGYDYSDSWGLIMTGGYRLYPSPITRPLDSVEVTKDGFNFETYQPMPERRALHCTAVVDDDRLIVAGGTTGGIAPSASAYMYSKLEDSWTRLSDMVTGRLYMSCRTITNQETGELEVIVPGGAGLEPGLYLSSVEIYNVQSGSWRVAGKCSN